MGLGCLLSIGSPRRAAPNGTSLPPVPRPLPVSIPVSSVQCYYIIYSFELEDDVCSTLYEFFIKTEKQPNLVSFESW